MARKRKMSNIHKLIEMKYELLNKYVLNDKENKNIKIIAIYAHALGINVNDFKRAYSTSRSLRAEVNKTFLKNKLDGKIKEGDD